jgi:ABC-type phosphate/phosphonate transport system substrate-binding protein
MYFTPSQARAAMTGAARDVARFVATDAGLDLHAEIPNSYSDVIAALQEGRADIAWMPPIAYLIAHREAGAEARLQVVRTFAQSAIVVTLTGPGAPRDVGELGGREVAVPASLDGELRARVQALLAPAAGWRELPVASDRDAVRALFRPAGAPAAAISSWVFSGARDLIGDGRKELEAVRPGTLDATRVIAQVQPALERTSTTYRGAFIARTDSGIRTLQDLKGRSIGYTDEASTSGFVFPRSLLRRLGIEPSAEYFLGGHPRVVQDVWAGRVAAGAVYYSPPSAGSAAFAVGDARARALERLEDDGDRAYFLERVRVFALTDPVPSDVCCVRRDLPEATWRRLHASIERFLGTPEGRKVYVRLVGGAGVANATDAAFDEMRSNLDAAGVDVVELLRVEEAKLGRPKGG